MVHETHASLETERQKAIERSLLAHELESHEGLAVELLAAQMQEADQLLLLLNSS